MVRRISTKWMLAVLAAVCVPFMGFAWYANGFVRSLFVDDVVRYHLLSHAAELAERLDHAVEERRRDVQVLSLVRDVALGLEGRDNDEEIFAEGVRSLFNGLVVGGGVNDYVLGLDATGRVLYTSTQSSAGAPLAPEVAEALVERDWASEPWFREVMETGSALLDWRRLDLAGPPDSSAVPRASDYHVGFAHRVLASGDPSRPVGAVLALMRWERVQDEVENYGVRREGAGTTGLVGEDIFHTSYAWVWGADADTILAHKSRELYGQSVSGPAVGLPEMTRAARASDAGMYPDYSFRGVEKKAAFRRMRGREDGGFGWVVGVGVDYSDIYGPLDTIMENLVAATLVALLVSALITLVVARRTTRPIQELERFTRQVALGDLDVQVPASGQDELGDLARSFNRMTGELKENREQLVRAEKEAAWREMARQVAHEIKNPLTPLRLSVDLLERAHAQSSPEFESILDRTIGVVRRQCDHMREIATDFHAFSGRHREHVPLDVSEALDDVLDLHGASALEAGIEVVRTGGSARIRADPDEFRRALQNLVSNAFEAMPDGGRLEVDVRSDGQRVTIEFRDDGKGLPAELHARLFEPYFTTRSSGTGLGLAIVRRIVEDLGGEVSLRNREPGPGAVATVVLPAARA